MHMYAADELVTIYLGMSKREARISEIINRITALTLETNALATDLKLLTSTNWIKKEEGTAGAQPIPKTTYHHGIEINDEVVITNYYKGSSGTRGSVVHTTNQQVTLRDDHGRLHTRKYTNVRKVN